MAERKSKTMMMKYYFQSVHHHPDYALACAKIWTVDINMVQYSGQLYSSKVKNGVINDVKQSWIFEAEISIPRPNLEAEIKFST